MSIAAVDAHPPTRALARRPSLDGLARVVPAARPGESVRLAVRRRLAAPVSEPASVTAILLGRAGAPEDGLEQRLAGWWDGAAPDVPLVVDEGCDVRVGRRPARDDERGALLAWLPPARRELVALEAGLLADRPVAAVTLLLRPPGIWSREEAWDARRLVETRRLDERRLEALERHGRDRVGPRHLLRLRAALLRLEAHAPFAGLPRATATVVAGCRALADDADLAVAVAGTQLARYACSSVVDRAPAASPGRTS